MSFPHVVLGELAPKSISIRRTETISLWASLPLFLFYWLMYPFIVVLNTSANLVLMSIRLRVADDGEDAHSADELKKMLFASHRHGALGDVTVRAPSPPPGLPALRARARVRPASPPVALAIRHDAARRRRLTTHHTHP